MAQVSQITMENAPGVNVRHREPLYSGGVSFLRQKVTNKRPELHEFRKLGRFAEIPVGAESVHVLAVAARIRGRHDQDQCVLAARAGAQLAQYLASFIARHVDVEQDEVRAGGRRVGVRLLEKPDRLLAVVGDVDLRVDRLIS